LGGPRRDLSNPVRLSRKRAIDGRSLRADAAIVWGLRGGAASICTGLTVPEGVGGGTHFLVIIEVTASLVIGDGVVVFTDVGEDPQELIESAVVV